MKLNDYGEVLTQVPLFARMTTEDIYRMQDCLQITIRTYRKGELILTEGEPVRYLGIVLEGGVQVFQDDYYGNRTIIGAFGPRQLFAEAFACADVTTLPVSVLATTDSVILLMDVSRVLHPCANGCTSHNMMINNLLKIVARKNMLLNQKLGYLARRTTRDKLMAYLSDQAKLHRSNSFTIPYDRQGLADFLCVERSAMSAEIGKLVAEGVLETKRSHFVLIRM